MERALALATVCVGAVAALGTNYVHDGRTTYCWAIPQPTNRTNLTETERTPAFAGVQNCPMELTIEISNGTIWESEKIAMNWTVTVDFNNGNSIENTDLFFGPDGNSGRQAQIVHSNVHSCEYGSGCDPFSDGKQLVDKTENKVANFTDNKAVFSDSLLFPTAGYYSVLAHIILPDKNESSRFDYAVYTQVLVRKPSTDAPPAAVETPTSAPVTAAPVTTTENSGGWSQEATIGVVVGGIVLIVALVVLAVIFRRRNETSNASNVAYVPAPVSEGDSAAGKKAAHTASVTMTNSTTGFDSAWAGPSDRPTTTDLDNTGGSSGSAGVYATPTRANPVNESNFAASVNRYQQQDQSASDYFSGSQVSTTRKKRIDSDVEL